MLTPDRLHDYQKQCVRHQLERADSMLWLQPGLGKTIITLTAIVERMRMGGVKKVLVFGPLRVIQSVWEREARKWEHTKHLRFSVMQGAKATRGAALAADADVYLCNYENMNWLAGELHRHYVDKGDHLPFDMVVYDEISKMKNSTSLRMNGGWRDRKGVRVKIVGWRNILTGFRYRVGLTGTPASNGYLDLHGQYLSVDGGARLGERVTHYKDSYFMSDYMGWNYAPTESGKKIIEKKISDITIKMDAANYLDMPKCKTVDIMVDLPPKARKVYDEIEKDLFAQLEDGTELEVFSRSAVSNKVLQCANGNAYLSPGSDEYAVIHDAKLDALEDIIEEAAGAPVLCSYSYKADAERIMERFKKLKPVNLTASKATDTGKIIDQWNSGGIKLLVGHPASVGHGLDGLQDSGSIVVWFGVNWSLELYEQMNCRIDRQGQKRPVTIFRILANDTLDLATADAIERKTGDQNGLKIAMQRYRLRNEVNFY